MAVVFSMMGLLYYFYKTWSTDPGYIKSSEEERKEVGDFVKTNGRAGVVQHGSATSGGCLSSCAALFNWKAVKYSSLKRFLAMLFNNTNLGEFLLLLLVSFSSLSCYNFLVSLVIEI